MLSSANKQPKDQDTDALNDSKVTISAEEAVRAKRFKIGLAIMIVCIVVILFGSVGWENRGKKNPYVDKRYG